MSRHKKSQMGRRRLKQFEFRGVKGWGGKRPGAGRPNLSGQVNHMKRPTIDLKAPLHITLRLRRHLPSLRRKSLLNEFKTCIKNAKEQGLYIIHFSLLSNHIHLFAEADDKRALALGMRALAGRFAKCVRAHASLSTGTNSKGSVFNGRYHMHILKTPTEVKNALEYVLLNLSKHQKVIKHIDEFSSFNVFKFWQKLLGSRSESLLRFDTNFLEKASTSDLFEILSLPQSWLGQIGWMRAST